MLKKEHSKYLEINKEQYYITSQIWLKGSKYFDKKLGQKLTKIELEHFDMLVNSGWNTFAKQSILIYRADQQKIASFKQQQCELCKSRARCLKEVIDCEFDKLEAKWVKTNNITRQYLCGRCVGI